MGGFFEILIIFLLSSVKFLLAPGVALGVGISYLQTILITTIGGATGVVVFYYFGTFIFRTIDEWVSSKRKNRVIKKKKVFTRRNRTLVRFRKRYGLPGLALLTPTILSIPIGTIIASRYFHNPYRTIPFLIASVFLWSLLLTSVGYYLKVKIT